MNAEVLDARPARTKRSRAKAPDVSDAKVMAESATPLAEPAATGDAPATEIAEELVDRAEISNGTALVKLSKSEALVQTLRAEAKKINFELVATDKESEQDARQFRMRVMGSITSLNKQCLELRRPAADFSQMVIKAERLVEADLRAIHKEADDALTALDRKREADREAKMAAEQAAAQKIVDAIASITSRPTKLIGQPSAAIAEAIAVIDAIEITPEEFADKSGEAMKAKFETLATLRSMHAGTAAMEQQQAALAEQQAAMDKARTAQAAIDNIKSMALRAIGQTAAQIAVLLADVEAIDTMADEFAGRDVEAMAAQSATLTTLRGLHTLAVATEDLAAKQAEQQAALDQQQAEQQARQAALDRAEADRVAEAARVEREAQERRDAITARITRMVELPERLEAEEASSVTVESHLRTLNDTQITIADFGDRQAEAMSLKERVLTELRNLFSVALTAENEAAAQRAVEEAERQRLAAEEAARAAAAAAALARAEATREAAPLICALLLQWRDADGSGDANALDFARAERDRLIATLNL